MEDLKSEKISLLCAVKYCIWVAFCPNKLEKTEIAKGTSEPSVKIITHAFWSSLIFIIASIALGYAIAQLLNWILQGSIDILTRNLQILGAVILLWATLFVRGWDIQTFNGSNITEKVNKWIFRFLYCLGTVIIVTSLSL